MHDAEADDPRHQMVRPRGCVGGCRRRPRRPLPVPVVHAWRITFESYRDGNWEIYAMNPDGTGQTNLTNHPAYDGEAHGSRNGERIVFSSNRAGDEDIWVMDADGTEPVQLTSGPDLDTEPTWSPCGLRIVFERQKDGETYDHVWIMDTDGSNLRQLTSGTTGNQEPVFSRCGTKILFQSERDGNTEIYVMDDDGSNQTRLTSNSDYDGDPQWTPDGKKIVFDSERTGSAEIFIMNADGTGRCSSRTPRAKPGAGRLGRRGAHRVLHQSGHPEPQLRNLRDGHRWLEPATADHYSDRHRGRTLLAREIGRRTGTLSCGSPVTSPRA